jgi:hypothetical protein
MAWRRGEIWLEAELRWFREQASEHGASFARNAPSFFALAAAGETDVSVPDGLASSRRRRAERRRRRHARRTRAAAALVIAPAAMLTLSGQRLGAGSAGGALQEDPPSATSQPMPDEPTVEKVTLLEPAPKPAPEREPQAPRIDWRRATSHGLHYAGRLTAGTQLPLEGADWVTWNPVDDRVPNRSGRLYGHERTIRAILAVAAAYREANPNAPRMVVGDISFRDGGPMELHRSHQNGLDVDVYYPRRDGRERAPTRRDQVDRVLAQDLLDRFVAAGAQVVFVGYGTGLRGPGDVVVPYPNHEDHMHVRFGEPR